MIGVTVTMQFSECSQVFAIQGLPLHVCHCINDYAGLSQGLGLFVREVDNRATIIKAMKITFNIFGVASYQLEQGREY